MNVSKIVIAVFSSALALSAIANVGQGKVGSDRKRGKGSNIQLAKLNQGDKDTKPYVHRKS